MPSIMKKGAPLFECMDKVKCLVLMVISGGIPYTLISDKQLALNIGSTLAMLVWMGYFIRNIIERNLQNE